MNSSWANQGGGHSGRQAGPYPSPPPQYKGNSPTGGQGMFSPPNPGYPAQAAQQVASRGVGATMQHGLTRARDAITNVSNNLTNVVNSNQQVQNMKTDPYVAATIMTSFLACTWAIGLLALGGIYYRKYGRLPTEDLLNITPDGLMIALEAERGRQGFTYGVFPPLIIGFLLKLTILAFLLHSQGKFKNWKLWEKTAEWKKKHLRDRLYWHRERAEKAKKRTEWHVEEAYRAGDERTDYDRMWDDWTLQQGMGVEGAGGPGSGSGQGHQQQQVYPMQTMAGMQGGQGMVSMPGMEAGQGMMGGAGMGVGRAGAMGGPF